MNRPGLAKCTAETRRPFDVALGARIRRRRVLAGLQLKQVGAYASMHYSSLSKIEQGWRRCKIEFLPRIARALQCSTDELLGLVPEAQVPQVK